MLPISIPVSGTLFTNQALALIHGCIYNIFQHCSSLYRLFSNRANIILQFCKLFEPQTIMQEQAPSLLTCQPSTVNFNEKYVNLKINIFRLIWVELVPTSCFWWQLWKLELPILNELYGLKIEIHHWSAKKGTIDQKWFTKRCWIEIRDVVGILTKMIFGMFCIR